MARLRWTWRMIPLFSAGVLLAAGCPSGPDEADPDGSASKVHGGAPVPVPPNRGDGSLRTVKSRADVRLEGPRVDARPGDWLLESAGEIAVVDARGGRIIDFGTAGGTDAMVALEPVVYEGIDDLKGEVASVGPVPGLPSVLRIERRVAGLPLRLWTFVSFSDRLLRIESVATSTGDAAWATVGEIVAWGNVPTWAQGAGFVTSGGTFTADFLAREGLGEAYAMGVEGGPVTARFHAPAAGFHERPHTAASPVPVAAGGESIRRVVWLSHARGAIGDAVSALLRARGAPLSDVTLPPVATRPASAEIESCDGAPFARFALGAAPTPVVAPAGCFRVRSEAPGYAPSPWFAEADLGDAGVAFEPRAGTVKWHVTDAAGAVLPARLLFRGIPPTIDPNWGEEPHDGAALEVVHTLDDGQIAVAPGAYRVTASRGPEYTTDEHTVNVEAGQTTAFTAKLDHVVDTRGWISADLHVHAVPSPDAPTLLDDRVRSLAAADVQVAVATDHNAVTDYGPTIRALGAGRWLASVVGDEVTTRGVEFGHFNVFPLPADAAPVPFEDTTPHDLFAAARAVEPKDHDKVLQVNHPRMGRIGYFEIMRFERSDFAAWRKRSPLFDESFDAVEVFNGDDYADLGKVETCMRDWFALLDAGVRVTATGNSDSHKLTYHEAGVPRNFVRMANDTPPAFDEKAFVEAVRAGRVVVSSGPFVRLRAGSAQVGDTIPAGEVDVHVDVQAPPWVDVRVVQLLVRGGVVREWPVKAATSTVRFDETARMTLRSGDWILAVARGDEPMHLLHRAGARPFAFTNPIFVR